MNREIKYRIWSKLIQRWITDLSLENLGNVKDEFNDLFLNDNVIYQGFTNWTDKNKREIYEGDILKCLNRTCNIYVEVIYDNYHSSFLIEKRFFPEFMRYNDVELVGNIFENSNLLNRTNL